MRHKLRIIWLVLCDRQWGMVKINQSFAMKPLTMLLRKRLAPDENLWTDLGEMDFAGIAQAMGAHAERVSDPEALSRAISRALEVSDGPTVIHVDVDPVAHMWAPGLMHFKAMHQEPKGK